MVWRFLSDIAFSDKKQLLLSCRGQLRKKDTDSDSKVSPPSKTAICNKKSFVLKCKNVFLFEKIEKMSNLILYFSKIPKTFICVRVRQVTFLSDG